MSTRDIQGHLRELYGTDVSTDLISRVTDAVIDEVKDWQDRPLEAMYPILYLDALFVSVRDGGTVIKAVYIALGMGVDGTLEVLGFWIEATESARLAQHPDGPQRIAASRTSSSSAATGLTQAIEAAFPKAVVQTCILHMIRASLRHVAWGDRRAVVAALKPIYAAETEEAAQRALAAFEERWRSKYPAIGRQWPDRPRLRRKSDRGLPGTGRRDAVTGGRLRRRRRPHLDRIGRPRSRRRRRPDRRQLAGQ